MMSLLFVANKQLPSNDYRVLYPRHSDTSSVLYALPGKPEGIDKKDYVYMGFGEGLNLRYLLEFLKLFVYLRKQQGLLDAVHFYSTYLVLLGPVVARLAGVPSFITITGFGRTFTSTQARFRVLKPLYLLLMRISVALTSRVLFQNHHDLAYMQAHYPKACRKFRYVGSAVKAPLVQSKDFQEERLRVLLVSRLLPDKGIGDFLQVAEALHGILFDFVLVGPGSVGFDGLLDRVQGLSSRGIIDYCGELDTKATLKEFARAHVLCFPSYGEGLARVMLEAGFAQVCPVAYDIPANRDLIVDDQGFLVPQGAVNEMIETLKYLAQDRSALSKNAKAYQAHVLANYDMVAFARRLDSIMAEAASEGSRGNSKRHTGGLKMRRGQR